ncbi:M24 family metallopeptidase, partial [Chloroflexota bacterium]
MKKEIAQRRERLRNLMREKDFDGVVLAMAQNLQYLTGIMEPSLQACGVLVMAGQASPVLAVLWLDAEAAQSQVEGVNIKTYTAATHGQVIAEAVKGLGLSRGRIGLDDQALRRLGKALGKSLPDVEFVNASHILEGDLRGVKSKEEIDCIEHACQIVEQGMETAAELLKPGITELELAAEAESRMIKLGSERPRHITIVASGSRARLVHPFASQKKIEPGDIVAIDMGATYHGYCSDLARTFAVGEPDAELKRGFDVFLKAQEATLEKLRPGVSIKELQAVPIKVVEAAGYKLVG